MSMFEGLENVGKSRRTGSFTLSLILELSVVTALVLAPVAATGKLPIVKAVVPITAPAPPPPPPAAGPVAPSGPKVDAPKDPKVFVAPTHVPSDTPTIIDEPRIEVSVAPPGVVGGVPGGKPEGVPGGIPDSIGTVPNVAPPPPPPPVVEAKKDPEVKRVRVGGKVEQPRLLSGVKPIYPEMAKKVRAQGTVRLSAVIAKDGRVLNLTVVSGHPYLVPAAIEAVQRWRYQPTKLNDEPVEVIAQIDVNFTLSN